MDTFAASKSITLINRSIALVETPVDDDGWWKINWFEEIAAMPTEGTMRGEHRYSHRVNSPQMLFLESM